MDTRRAKSDINITPLIDIVLVLLIVFIVLVPGLVPSLKVSVPRVVTDDGGKPDIPPVVVTLDREGRLYLQREEITLAGLSERLLPVVLLQPLQHRKVFFKMDGELPHERAVQVLDEIRVASDRAKAITQARPGFQEETGGDVKVAISLAKGEHPA